MMSDVRAKMHPTNGEELVEDPALKSYEVFVRTKPGVRHTHAGTLEAPDAEMAVQFAREHYGQDEPCVGIWVVPREAVLELDQEQGVIWRTTDQTYRLARGYSRDVRKKWEQFRESSTVDKYQSEDLKETF